MTNLHTITSSSMTALSRRLARQISSEAVSPLDRQTVVVQSSGMARWISMELARLNGVCANMNYLYPNTFLDMISSCIIPEAALPSPYTVENMSWRIMELLPAMFDQPGFEPLRKYCRSRSDDRALLQLSAKIADSYDQYTIFRPGMILDWDQGKGEGWQPELWRAMSTAFDGFHHAKRLEIIRERISGGAAASAGLPSSINIFGISYLPPYHLETVSLLSGICRITIFMLNPCGEYWGEIISPRALAAKTVNSDMDAEAKEYYETGNPLLSSLGTMGQEFFNLLLDRCTAIEDLDDSRPAAESSRLLGQIQSDILQLRDRSGTGSEKGEVAAHDDSIQIHSCHSPLREMEVLYDNLLRMFRDMPTLEPRHIVVMTPDIEAYAPYISAVFGSASGDRPLIPFTIADRSQRSENSEIETFLRILHLPNGRFGINQVLELLKSASVMSRFELCQDEIVKIQGWLEAANVRWGIDADHRARLGFPPYGDNSWKTAFDRLLLGYALPDHGSKMFNQILPCGFMEGKQSLALGKLADFFRQACRTADLLTEKRALSDWADTLASAVSSLMSPSGLTDNSMKPIHEAIRRLMELQESSGFNSRIGLDAVKDYLAGILEGPGASYGFLDGKVTFCAMLPMRSIPFRVICLAGMNDNSFPRSSRLPGFSLMAGKRKPGDKSLREEDRYLFLEALMSCGERLFISYTGQSNRDNSQIPPSVVVSELMDYIAAGYSIGADNGATAPRVTVMQHLQPFSEAYFMPAEDNPLFSYSRTNYTALAARRASGRREQQFCQDRLPAADGITDGITLGSLLSFFRNPAAFFLSHRFGVRPGRVDAATEEREYFSLDALVGYGLKEELVLHLLNGESHEELFEAAKAGGRLPPLTAGRLAFQEALNEARRFTRRLSPYFEEHQKAEAFQIRVGGYDISGELQGLTAANLIRFRCAGMKAKDLLGIWIEHLILNMLSREGCPRTSMLICRDTSLALPVLNNAGECLLQLMEIFQEGLLRPVPFFPETSRIYQEKGILEAERRWSGNGLRGASPDSEDPAFDLCFGRVNPLNGEFRQIAATVYGPIFKVLSN